MNLKIKVFWFFSPKKKLFFLLKDLEGLLGELNNNVELVIDLIKNEHTLDKGLSSNTKERSFLQVTTNRTANKPTQLDKRPQNKSIEYIKISKRLRVKSEDKNKNYI
jgi:hypothetical protein